MKNNKNYNNFIGKKTSAYKLLEILEKDFNYKIKAPIEIKEILEILGIPFSQKPNFAQIKLDGKISIENDEPFIWSNPLKTKIKERLRFTLAHELGHFLLHMAPENSKEGFTDKNISFNRDDNWDHKEMEANSFAAQLLMPSELITKHIKDILKKTPDIERVDLIEELASIFQVSSIAMKYRLKNMGINIDMIRQEK